MTDKILSGKSLGNAIAGLAKRSAQLQKDIHIIAVSCCIEIIKTGNTTRMNDFDKAVEHIGRRAIRRWLAKHGPVSWNLKENRFDVSAKKKDEALAKGLDTYTTGLLNGPTYVDETKQEDTDPFKPVNIPRLIKAILGRVDRMTDEQKANEENDFEGIEELKALAAKAPVKKRSKKPEANSAAVH